MYEYEFETIVYNHSLLGGWGKETVKHQEIILRRAEDGWRYAGCIPRSQQSHGFVEEMDLVFERECPDT